MKSEFRKENISKKVQWLHVKIITLYVCVCIYIYVYVTVFRSGKKLQNLEYNQSSVSKIFFLPIAFMITSGRGMGDGEEGLVT